MAKSAMDPSEVLGRLWSAAVDAAQPDRCLPPSLPQPPAGRTVVVGAGKAAAAMARTLEQNWPTDVAGLVVTRYGHRVPCERIDVIEAAHPVPDQAGLDGARRILGAVAGLGEDDLVIALMSGGGSALLTLPADGIALADKRRLNDMLLRCGATIGEINTVRKHLSAIKGGRLAAAAWPAAVVALAISDVPGDDPATIASGPTVADPTTMADARSVIAKYGLTPPVSIADHLESGAESPKPGDPTLTRSTFRLIASPGQSIAAAAACARQAGLEPIVLGDAIEGEARVVGQAHAELARARAADRTERPVVLLSGGELTVTIAGDGRGGPNAEYALALAIGLDGMAGVHALAGDTDGIDGSEDNAGASVGPDTLTRAQAAGLDARDHLTRNDSYGFFAALGDLLMTGPTLTNVNDFRAILIGAPDR